MRKLIICFFTLFIFQMPLSWLYAAKETKLIIDITNPNFRKFVIAIPPFVYKGSGKAKKNHRIFSERMAKTIGDFLETTGLFESLSKKHYVGDAKSGDVNLPDWQVLKVDGLVYGTYSMGSGGITTEIKFFDVFRSKLIIWKKYYKGSLKDVREIAKRFCNEIIYILTGEEGIFKSKIVFLRKIGKYKNVHIMDIDGKNIQAITNKRTIHLSPNWSPDGKKITYTSYKRGNPDLYIYSMLTKKEIRISAKKGLNTGASWTPDGRKILFTRSRKGDSDIYSINPDGTGLKAMIKGYGLDITPRMSPDSKNLIFVSGRSGSPHIWIMNMLTHKLQKLTRKGRYNADPSWSPDGKSIAFAGFDNGHFDIFIMKPDPINPQFERLTINSNDNEHPSWSPDGRHIIFQSNRDGQYELYLMNADGSNQRRLTFGLGEVTAPQWSRNKLIK